MNRVKELRQGANLSQAELGKILGCHSATVSKYELEQRQLDPATIGQLCDYFHVTADYLLCRSSVPYQTVSSEDARLLKVYHSLPPEIRRAVDGLMEPYAAAIEEKKAV